MLTIRSLVSVSVSVLVLGACSSGSTKQSVSTTTSSTTLAATTTTVAATTTTAAGQGSGQGGQGGVLPAGGPVPAGFWPWSFTALSDTEWWLLGDVVCSHKPCTSIVRTTDGGKTFVGLPAPVTPITRGISEPAATNGVDQLRFADAQNGFAYGPSLWVTHNGGANWHAVHLPGVVSQLEAAHGEVFAIVDNTIYHSPAGSDTWVPGTRTMLEPQLALHGSDVLVSTVGGNGLDLLVSHDAGAHFTTYLGSTAGLPCQFQEPVTSVIWGTCATGTEAGVERSTNGGATFSPLSNPVMFPNTIGLAAPSSTVAIVTSNNPAAVLWRTTDGGHTFALTGPSLPNASWLFAGFTDSTTGVVIASTENAGGTPVSSSLYRTTDGGLTWSRIAIS